LRYKDQLEQVKAKGFFMLDDGSKSTDHLVKVKVDKTVKSAKTKDHSTQTEKVLLATDLDYAGALKLARSLQPKPAGVVAKDQKTDAPK
jgi:hypothetical protein